MNLSEKRVITPRNVETRVIDRPCKNLVSVKLLAVLCVFVLSGILFAGLWPFGHPNNQVSWLQNANGLRFGEHGTILSSNAIRSASSPDKASASLEIWLQPSLIYEMNTILAFYTPENPLQFSLRKHDADLILQAQSRNVDGRTITAKTYVTDVFRGRKPVFITITSSKQETAIFVDGVPVRTSSHFRLSSDALTGRLVVGTSPVESDNWSGQLRGLAIYSVALTPSQVFRHYDTWTKSGRPEVMQNEFGDALYLFDERIGNVIHNEFRSGTDLYIPERYLLLDEKFLEPAWKEFDLSSTYAKNVLINIFGFIPFGFFFCAFLSALRHIKRPSLTTVMLGAIVSLTIEVLQAYLPTRNSGTTDLITNTLGTYLGVMLFRWKAAFLFDTLNRISYAFVR